MMLERLKAHKGKVIAAVVALVAVALGLEVGTEGGITNFLQALFGD